MAVIDSGRAEAELCDAGTGSLQIEDARPASWALQALDGVAGQVRGELEQIADRAGPLGALLLRLGPAGFPRRRRSAPSRSG